MHNQLAKLDADQVFDIMRKLNNSTDPAKCAVFDLAADEYMARVPESTFVQAMDILDNEMEWQTDGGTNQ